MENEDDFIQKELEKFLQSLDESEEQFEQGGQNAEKTIQSISLPRENNRIGFMGRMEDHKANMQSQVEGDIMVTNALLKEMTNKLSDLMFIVQKMGENYSRMERTVETLRNINSYPQKRDIEIITFPDSGQKERDFVECSDMLKNCTIGILSQYGKLIQVFPFGHFKTFVILSAYNQNYRLFITADVEYIDDDSTKEYDDRVVYNVFLYSRRDKGIEFMGDVDKVRSTEKIFCWKNLVSKLDFDPKYQLLKVNYRASTKIATLQVGYEMKRKHMSIINELLFNYKQQRLRYPNQFNNY